MALEQLRDQKPEKAVSNHIRYSAYLFFLCLLCGVSISPFALQLEQRLGLPLLYQLRDLFYPVLAPSNVIVVTPYKDRRLDDADVLTGWNRTRHGDAIKQLAGLGAELIVFDIFFRTAKGQEDAIFARAISEHAPVVLNQSLNTVRLGDSSAMVAVLKNPASRLAQSAAALAPAIVPITSGTVIRYSLFHQVLYDRDKHLCYGFSNNSALPVKTENSASGEFGAINVPTLPVAAIELLLASRGEYDDLPSSVVTGLTLDNSKVDCIQRQSLRRSVIDNIDPEGFVRNSENSNQLLEEWKAMIHKSVAKDTQAARNTALYLNFYGPPGTIQTIDYRKLENLFVNSEQAPRIIQYVIP